MPLFTSAPNSLCILRLSAIGDVCNTIAAVQMIQKQWPETKITWITGKLEAHLIGDLPNINVVVFDKKLGWKGYTQLWKTLKNERFDALLHMQYALRASVATLGIKAKYKLGFDKERSNDFQTLFTNYKVPSPQKTHVLDGLIAFVKELGVNTTNPTWDIPTSSEDNAWASSQLSDVNNKNLVIVPAASKAYKNWNAQGYADVIHHAQSKGWTITLAGSPAQVEIDLAANIESLLNAPVKNLVGKSSLKEMLALLKQANLVIAPDTGPAHMANAVNTPIIGLYAHHNPDRTCPYQYRDYVVTVYDEAIKAETGKDKSELSWRTRVQDKQAMNRIRSEQVIAMFDKAVIDFSL
ncbi:ADP-heptose--LPS heptosyltransferase I [Aliivibrio fischeri]|uniref:ADP-heptose--LPS heptosyltransferase I n=1 Tax=Aliivibrio fischeri TaxID=668 RepID=A0A6N3Z2I5_ALIFS|nr:glycosyltransferase family 9 protein [Aliivibrio fischeri]MUJ21772.1 ADP-heptose--LPS heptosyltransferase I [Aliivibrio fischeri]MUK46131.1 ADP-heptose--LPS heptosyltransferase I [Aliivibrio fischeri]MUK79265.1 ADP-heptose--LPS heptosyltransferase I [Aliivibrio fischeri]MUK85907.1 ADP-heptose--LPS heptosyltransferase I [Aliivibrio fischeri]